MKYSDFNGLQLSLLGFGAMRLPLLENKSIDEEQVQKMVDYAIENGVNYFDTAWPYHNGLSEIVMGKCLSKHPRESWYLATKYPGHQISSSYNPAEIFEQQLKKCGVEYFDFYLLHNIYENSIQTYTDERWGIVDYFVEQKKLGRIRHLGFSSHADLPVLTQFLDLYGDKMEFAQIQMNYLDWTLQNAKEKYELLEKRGIPVWVMEPLRGGKLSHLSEAAEKTLLNRSSQSVSSWSFRYLMSKKNVKVILSGMSNFEQMKDNINTFNNLPALNDEECALMEKLAEEMKDSVPCTACRYCTSGCPKKLDIPELLKCYNDLRFDPTFTVSMKMEAVPENGQPSQCIGCKKCERICPQKIKISECMKDFAATLEKMPKWSVLCKQREEAAKKLMEK